MVSSPVQNISDFLKNKPPVVVFILCLVALAVSTFYFAFEIEKDGPTVDSNKIHDWTSMRKHFNTLDTCINLPIWNNKINVKGDEEQFKKEGLVFTKVTIEDVNSLKPFSRVYGTLTLDGWFSTTCQDEEKLPKTVDIYFEVPPQTKLINGSLDLCVRIEGPAEYLPRLKKDLMCQSVATKQKNNNKDVQGVLVSKLPRIPDLKFCAEGKSVKFIFDLEPANVENFLNDDVRTEIYIHLIWCSYFLVFIIFCILLYAIIKKSEYLEKKEQSVRLL